MNKILFVKTINAIQEQIALDINIANHLGKAFPNAFEANLLPDNSILQNALIAILKDEMNDDMNNGWIEYFIWELDFGKENYRLKVTSKGKNIKLSTASDLYDLLKTRIKP